jgi:hypothetical protein
MVPPNAFHLLRFEAGREATRWGLLIPLEGRQP